MKRVWLAMLLLLSACAYNGKPAEFNLERVVDRNGCTDISNCYQFNHYRHISDMFTPQPGFWLISNQGHVCLVDDATFTIYPNGQMYDCKTGWRFYRP